MTSTLVDEGSGMSPIDPKSIQINPASTEPAIESRAQAALRWLGTGFRVIPVLAGEKRTVLKWDPWLEGLSAESVQAHWRNHPDHDLGVILGDEVMVFDTDSSAAIEAFEALMHRHGVSSNLIINTTRGRHYYFRRAPGTIARSDSHDTKVHPERIDVKAGCALVVLPPSGGRKLVTPPIRNADELVEIGQDLIDAVFKQNGRSAPRRREQVEKKPLGDGVLVDREAEIAALLDHLDPDLAYDDWVHAGMAAHQATNGSDAGLEIFNAWSSRGRKYKSRDEIENKWQSFRPNPENAYTFATLMRMVEATGVDPVDVCAAAGPQFEPCDYLVVGDSGEARDADQPTPTLLDRFSLRGRADEVERNAVDEVPLLGRIALLGQLTVIYAAPNTGKTLLVLYLLLEAIRCGRVDPERVYYMNVDDDANGLLTKLRIADEFGFHVLADGYLGFSTADFLDVLREMIAEDQARGVVVILDTLKKFTDLMDKSRASAFMSVARRFIMRGGTIIGLAHTNKHPGADGRPVFAGTTDVRDDADCVYTLRPLDASPGDTDRVVVFDNSKRRGNVAIEAGYRYCVESGITYPELLASVEPFDHLELLALKKTEAERTDADLITAVQASIREGVDTKMRLAAAVAERAGVSKRTAIRVIEKYTGDDPARHHWTFSVQARGAKVFALIEAPPPASEVDEPEAPGGCSHD